MIECPLLSGMSRQWQEQPRASLERKEVAYPVMRTVPTGAMMNRGLVWRGFQQALGGRAGARCVKG